MFDWKNDFNEICNRIKSNNAAIVETDTVLGIISLNPELIYEIKKRDKNKKLITFINDINQIKNLTEKEINVLNKFWPGGLSIIKNNISYRMPNEKNILKLISIVGPVFSSSANISGNEVFKNVFEAKKDFDNIKNLIFVDGKKNSSLPSTIINFDTKEIIREGCISGSEIIKLLK